MASPRKRRIVRGESDSEPDEDIVISPSKRQRRIVLDEDDEEPFSTARQSPARDGADIALLESLKSIQKQSSSPLPDLPPEILLTVLEHVSAAQLLDLRQVSKSFRDAIDTHVFYHHIQQAELVGYLGARNSCEMMEQLSSEDYWKFSLVRTQFEALDECEPGQAKWDPEGAGFRVETSWMDTLHSIGGSTQSSNAWWDHTLGCLDLDNTPQVYGQLRWCVKVGGAALDFGIEDKLAKETDIELLEDSEGILIRVTDWKAMLWNFFREERYLRTVLEEKTYDTDYTYGHLEDCLKSMRRLRFKNALDLTEQEDRSVLWRMNHMRPLFGKSSYHEVQEIFYDVAQAEDEAIRTIMMLRREAAMSRTEHETLHGMVREMAEMRKEMIQLDGSFKEWQENVLVMRYMSLARLEFIDEQEEDANPLTWTDQKLSTVQETLKRWKGQRHMIKQMTSFLDATNAVAKLSDGAFDDEENDF